MLLAVVDEAVGIAEVEQSLLGLHHLALHAVFGHGSIEMLVDDGIGLRTHAVGLGHVEGRTDETVLAYNFSQALCKHGLRCKHY